MYLKIIAPILTFAIGFGAAWSWQDSRSSVALLEQMQAVNDATMLQIETEKKLIAERAARYKVSREAIVKREIEDDANEEKSEEIRIEYITADPNAVDCGLSAAGVRVWNTDASNSTLPESAGTGPLNYGGPIAARNSEVLRAHKVSARRHWKAIRQIENLKAYIVENCPYE